MVLSGADIANFKSVYSVVCIHVNCDPSAAKDKSLPRSAYLVHCDNGTEVWYDIVMGSKLDIFHAYYDKYGNVVKNISWTDGKIVPKLWNYTQKEDTKKKN
tara:strand:+ start:3030 stop:3332 length:303 start_codon:yes stop_codon:yes gene_type:complete